MVGFSKSSLVEKCYSNLCTVSEMLVLLCGQVLEFSSGMH